MKADINLIEAIANDLGQYREEDVEAFWDTLDGETDILDVMDKAIASQQSDESMCDAIAGEETMLKKRRQRIAMRSETTRKVIGKLLKAAGMKSAERPRATVSVRAGNASVSITIPDDIPTQLTRTKTTISPDKTAIKKQIDAGEAVPGATLVTGSDIVTIRTN